MVSSIRFATAIVALICLAVVTCFPSSSRAGYTIYLTDPNADLSSFTGPYATITVDLVDSTHANVTLTSLSSGQYTYLFGGQHTLALNLNAAFFSVGNISGSQAGLGGNYTLDPWELVSTGSGNVSEFGDFNFTIKSKGGFTRSIYELTLTVTNLSGTWVDDASVLTPNADGYRAAGHVFVWNPTAPSGGSDVNPLTGFSGDGPVIANPVPPSIVMAAIGTACVCLFSARRLRMNKSAT